MMEVDSWRGEGGFEAGEGGRGGGEVWISRHQTDRISTTPNNFGESLQNSKSQRYLSPELEQRRADPATRKKPEKVLGKEGSEVTQAHITVGDTDEKPGRISEGTFGQNNIESRLAWYIYLFVCKCLEKGGFHQKMLLLGPGSRIHLVNIQLKAPLLDFLSYACPKG